MSEKTNIEWCDSTWNPWEGCQKVGPGCDHCYAETRNARFAGGTAVNWGPGAPRRRTSASNWRKPLTWNAAHAEFFAEHGRRQRVFCASLADVFDNAVDPLWRADLFDLIDRTPNLDWLLLTKRVGNVGDMVPAGWLSSHPNVWIGASIVNQAEADRDIPKLLELPALVRFLSMEPLLGPVDLKLGRLATTDHRQKLDGDVSTTSTLVGSGVHWVIVGGESGPRARPMSPDWARELRDQCAAANVPFLFKQWGEWGPAESKVPGEPGRFVYGDYPGDRTLFVETANHPTLLELSGAACLLERVGKKVAGRALDGHQHDGFPPPRGNATQIETKVGED